MPSFDIRRITRPFSRAANRGKASRLDHRENTAALWARVQAAEKEHQAALARYEALERSLAGVIVDPTAEWYQEYEDAHRAESALWVEAEESRHDLDRFFHPRRYAKKGYREEALGKFYARAEPGEPETGFPQGQEQPPDGPGPDAQPRAGHESQEDLRSRPSRLAPTPYELGLSTNPNLSWADSGITQPTPGDLFGCDPGMSWENYTFRCDPGPFYEEPQAEP